MWPLLFTQSGSRVATAIQIHAVFSPVAFEQFSCLLGSTICNQLQVDMHKDGVQHAL